MMVLFTLPAFFILFLSLSTCHLCRMVLKPLVLKPSFLCMLIHIVA